MTLTSCASSSVQAVRGVGGKSFGVCSTRRLPPAERESIRQFIEEVENIARYQSDRVMAYSVSAMLAAEDKRTDKLRQEASTQAVIRHHLETPKVQGKGLLQAFVKYTEKSQPETTTMTTTSRINITTQVNINGVNADTYSDATLFAMIQQQEAEIKNLQSIANKPQSLLAEIAARQAGIDSLVAFMDEREAKRNPQPAQPAKPSGPDLQTLHVSV